MIRMDNNQQVEYKDVKIMCLYPLLIYGRGGIIAITLQIFTHDNETIDFQIHYKSDTVKRRYFLFNTRANIFDIIKTRKIKYKWIRKKK
jgi:hypothetical protein